MGGRPDALRLFRHRRDASARALHRSEARRGQERGRQLLRRVRQLHDHGAREREAARGAAQRAGRGGPVRRRHAGREPIARRRRSAA